MINEHDINDWVWFDIAPAKEIPNGSVVSLPGDTLLYYVKGVDHLNRYIRMFGISDKHFLVPIFISYDTKVDVYGKASNY